MANQGLLAVSFFEVSATAILLALYLLLYRNLPERFFRLWVAGWILHAGFGLSCLLYCWRGGLIERLAANELLIAASVFSLAAALDCTGHGRYLRWLWAPTLLAGIWMASALLTAPQSSLVAWSISSAQGALFLAAGWVMWRHSRTQKAFGPVLLGAALLLRGIHWLDHPAWPGQVAYSLRMAFDGLFVVAMGVAMVVLVLEESRARAEDLNNKLRQLALITTAATQTFKVDKVLREVLEHLVKALRATYGMVRLLEEENGDRSLVLRASLGFNDEFTQQRVRLRASEPWAQRLLQSDAPFIAQADAEDTEVREWMNTEKLCAIVLVRLPGKDVTLGMLGIGCQPPRAFRPEEVTFLVNVANLLGLTVQNVWLFEKVSEAQRQWMNTFDSITDPILVHDGDGRVLRVNRALAGRLGTEPIQMVGRPVAELLRQGEHRWNRCPYCEGVAGRGDRPDPSIGGNLLVTNSDFHDSAGNRLGIIHVLKDITDRNRAERMYRNLFENVREGVFITTPAGRFVDFNDAFMQIVGYESRAALMNADILTTFYVDPADRERLQKLLIEHGAVTNFEYRLRRGDGEVIDVSESSFASRDGSGKVGAYQGFLLDITERKRAESELRRRNRELMVLNSIALTLSQSQSLDELLNRALTQVVELFGADLGAVYLLDEKNMVLHRRAAVGYRSEYARHFPPTAIPPEPIQKFRQLRATVVPEHSLPMPRIMRDMYNKEGVQVSHLVVLWSKDRIMGGLTVASRSAREFSAAELNLLTAAGNQMAATIEKSLLYEETRRAYENLRRTQEQLLQSEKMAAVGQLISGVAHELNNPLTAILGYSQLLTDSQEVTPRGGEFIDKLYRQAQRTHRIVQNLLSFARQHRPERLPVHLNQILEDTLTLREYDLKLNNILVRKEFALDLPVTSGDAHQLQQVFLNILNNAVDAVLEAGGQREIWISTRLDESWLKVEFTDSGRGLQDPLRVFDPFYTTKAVGKGTGLGLSICYGIIKEHGGEIAACNAPPHGATFVVSLPFLPVSEKPRPVAEQAQEQPLLGTVLLVDDEDAVLELEQEILRGQCAKVLAARSGRQALEALERENVDVVVTDLKMPGEVTGRELFQWIQTQRPELAARVLFTVSDAGTPDVRAYLERVNCSFVQKPFRVEEFLRVLRQVVTQPVEVTR